MDLHLQVRAEFDFEVERYPVEPYSHGFGRGFETEVTATLTQLDNLNRAEAIKAFGPAKIRELEEEAEERYE